MSHYLSPKAIAALVGAQSFARGVEYAEGGYVEEFGWFGSGTQLFGTVHGNRPAPYTVAVSFGIDAHGHVARIASTCTCPMMSDCKHVAALILVSNASLVDADTTPRSSRAAEAQWRTSLAPLARDAGLGRAAITPLALQFSLLDPVRPTKYSAPVPVQTQRLGIRPMSMGKQGKWIRGQLSWPSLTYARGNFDPAQMRVLTSLFALHTANSHYMRYDTQWLHLDAFPSRALWQLLGEANSTGLALVYDSPVQQSVLVSSKGATVDLDLSRSPDGLVVAPALGLDGRRMRAGMFGFIGDPAHGVFTWDPLAADPDTIAVALTPPAGSLGPAGVTLSLAPLAKEVNADIRNLAMSERTVVVPPADEPLFVSDYYPMLSRNVALISSDGSFEFPQHPQPHLVLSLLHRPGAIADLEWEWEYRSTDSPPPVEDSPPGETERRSLWPGLHDTRFRDPAQEAEIIASLAPIVGPFEHLWHVHQGGRRLGAGSVLIGSDTVDFVSSALPLIRELERVRIRLTGELPDYRAAEAAPLISLSASERPDSRDWFDLSVTVTIDAEAVPFDELFRALALDQDIMVLPSGTYFSLDNPDLRRLRSLIEEAKGLQESQSDSLGLSRFQADLWDELEALGVVSAQTAAWREAIAGLTDASTIPSHALPASVNATLRPYQQAGFDWLSFLHGHRLGGILADDMGLGKTLQAIALIAQSREGAADPFLVVAPTSVVSNWAAECRRFAPDLNVVAITETTAKSAVPLADRAAGADLVITSYTLFRLDFDEIDEMPWAGLLLDEAQFVKNHRSAAHQCARRLRAPFKLAITGTPMENNLMELWSLLSITAPGLFPSPTRFAEYYQKPIERELDAERLAQLRRRIRPFMLRRTKDEVAKDLPAKQEQVLELDLHPKHRKVYDTHLQRERQKVLGLIDDMTKNRFEIFRSLTMLRQLSLDASLYDDAYASIPSTKLDALIELLDDIVAEGHRTLIFSQFTGYLAKARTRLDAAGITYSYLDGKTRNRAKAIADFKDGNTSVFLISLKAGGFGLNLTEADYCILLDPWWNPATEAQAVDRAHRIGQTRKVMVYRLVSKDTIEEKVMALKASKAQLFSSVMEGAASGGTGLSAADIRELLS